MVQIEEEIQKYYLENKRLLEEGNTPRSSRFDYFAEDFKISYFTEPKGESYDLSNCIGKLTQNSSETSNTVNFTIISLSSSLSHYARRDLDSIFLKQSPLVKIAFYRGNERISTNGKCSVDEINIEFQVDLHSHPDFSQIELYLDKGINIFNLKSPIFTDQCESLSFNGFDTTLAKRKELLYLPPFQVCNEQKLNLCSVTRISANFAVCYCETLLDKTKPEEKETSSLSLFDKSGFSLYKCAFKAKYQYLLQKWYFWLILFHFIVWIGLFLVLYLYQSKVYSSIPHKNRLIFNDCWNFSTAAELQPLAAMKVEVTTNPPSREENPFGNLENIVLDREIEREFDRIREKAEKKEVSVVKFNPFIANLGTNASEKAVKRVENKETSSDFPFTPTFLDLRRLNQSEMRRTHFLSFPRLFLEMTIKLNSVARVFFLLSLMRPIGFRVGVLAAEIYFIFFSTAVSFTDFSFERRLEREQGVNT